MSSSNVFLPFFIFYFLFSSGLQVLGQQNFKPTRLFVFGDSYADTGNLRKADRELGYSWYRPYGMTYPGKPTGRFSDGLVLTDFIAQFLGLMTPWPYHLRHMVGMDKLYAGMNFAYGGSGVFNTTYDVLPNLSTQVDRFEQLVSHSVYTKQDLKSSIAYVSCAGNDYATWLAQHPNESIYNIINFVPDVTNALTHNLKRIHDLGVPKVLVTGLQPLGCSPRVTVDTQYKNCSFEKNLLVELHNMDLDQALVPLNDVTVPNNSTFFKLELYDAFDTVITSKGNPKVNAKFENPLIPACMGIDGNHYCGDIHRHGKLMYRLTRHPKAHFWWDASHPTQMGWKAVFKHLEADLAKFLRT